MNAINLKNVVLIVAAFLIRSEASSQDMYVGANSFVYASNQFVYLKSKLELNATTSNFYLRNEGQLIQGTTGAGENKGLGSLSVYQEGTVNNYQYNYWCSPVGNAAVSSSTNNLFGIRLLGRPTSVTTSDPVAILGSNNYDGKASPLSISPSWIYKYLNSSTYYGWIFAGSSTTIAPGEGFIMKGTSGTDTTTINGVQNNPGSKQRYDFRGKPNDGTINVSVSPSQLTLTGNPYPSAINLQAFLMVETNPSAANCTGIAYFWEQDKTVNSHYIADYKGGYGSYSPGTDVYIPAVFYSYNGYGEQIATVTSPGIVYERKYAPIGQGFLIEGKVGATGNVQMKNSFRVFVKEGAENNSQFERKTNTLARQKSISIPQIRLNTLIDNGPISQMVLAFDSRSSKGIDHAMDAESQNESSSNNYFVVENKECVIDVVPFDSDAKIAIGFRNTKTSNYKITVNEMLNIPEVENVFLHDKTTNLYYDIKNSIYDLTLPAGTYNSRYEITFKNGSLGVDTLENKRFMVRQDNTSKNLEISNPLQLELTKCSLYDVVGRLVFSKDQLPTATSYSFSTSDLSNGIYIVKLMTADKTEMGQKIIVKN